MNRISMDVNKSELNSLFISKKSINGVKYGFLSAGIPYAHLKDALNYLEIEDKVSILKLGIVYPLPRRKIIELLHSVDKLLIVEELEPIFETMVKKIAFEEGFGDKIEIHGKDILPQKFEFPAELIIEKVSEFLNIEFDQTDLPENKLHLPPRLPMLCPGCSHRATFYAINQVEKKLKKQFINSSDIGCYTLGVYKPLEAIDTQICMGGSIGMANGFSKLYGSEQPLLAIIGDSTFFHTGIPGLINAVYNQNDMLVVILDNRSTSMTGFQDNPGTGMKITEEPGTRIVLEDLVKGCGVPEKNIWVEDSNNIDKMIRKLEEAVEAKGVRVFISRHICSLLELSEFKVKNISPPTYKIDNEQCTGCQICINQFGCPAIIFDEELKKAKIDQSQCRGCGVCTYVCPQEAIHEEEI
ncbi:MAG: indolepyruvate ferredoxin oxidoreductase subunit alpha [Promethearchaeota archaeon]|nr:MAG: indolepyruvate ferredoxin oxidoreductase subunit alpha [Candidatus Lokiarchaeota archaeon]